MDEPIYFSKIEFTENIGYSIHESTILLNLSAKELAYQTFKTKFHRSPVIQEGTTEEFNGKLYFHNSGHPAKWVASDKTNFEPALIKDSCIEKSVTFSFAIKLNEQQMKELLPLCNALDFEPFRDRKMEMDDEGIREYRDEVRLKFRGITDSHIPLLELPMTYYYDEAHIWPSEKLYRHIIKNIFSQYRQMKGHYTTYGGFSLPYINILF